MISWKCQDEKSEIKLKMTSVLTQWNGWAADQGWTGKLSRGGAGQGGARPKIYGAGPGRKRSKSAGRGTYCVYQLIEIIRYSKGFAFHK